MKEYPTGWEKFTGPSALARALPMANHHFLLFIPDDPENFNLPNPGLANCTAIPRMKIITIGGDAGPEIRYKKVVKAIPSGNDFIYLSVYEAVSPPFKNAGVYNKYSELCRIVL